MKTVHRDDPSAGGSGRSRVTHSARPNRDHSSPITTAVASDARHRASTSAGWPGNATAVATSTTGLIAGAESMNVSAAAPLVPGPNSRRATGTDPHSQPGSAAPPIPASATANAGLRGNHRDSRSALTNAAISPLTTTPSTRNGSAWTNTPQNTVAAVLSRGSPATKALIAPAETASAMRLNSKTSREPTRRLVLGWSRRGG